MNNKQILGNALEDVLYDKFMLELANCQENAKCSRKHFQTMQEIIGCKIKKIGSHSRRIIAAILVAATLLLAGCVAYVYREEIKGFFVEFHDSHLNIEATDNKTTVTEYYLPQDIPSDYHLTLENKNSDFLLYKWEKQDAQTGKTYSLEFRQMTAGSIFIDNKNANTEVIKIGDMEIMFHQMEYGVSYIWSSQNYMFELFSDETIGRESIEKIILSISQIGG